MKKFNLPYSIKLRLIVSLSWLSMTSCTSIQEQEQHMQMSGSHEVNTAQLQEKLPQSDKKYPDMLKSAEEYLLSGQLSAAESLLKEIKINEIKSHELKAYYLYLSAQSATQRHQWTKALQLIEQAQKQKPLIIEQEISLLQLAVELYNTTNQPIKQAAALHAINEIEPSSNLDARIWYTLQPVSEDLLKQQLKKTRDKNFNGWLELSYIGKRYADLPQDLQKKVNQWQQDYPEHPHYENLPDDINRALHTQVYNPKKVGVLLPAKATSASRAIRSGIIASTLKNKARSLELHFYDTSEGGLEAYNRAEQDECEFIIGPLLKEHVEEVASSRSNIIPQLMLNMPDGVVNDPDRYYFSLSPTEEAAQTAQYFKEQGIKNPLIIANSRSSSKKMVESFTQAWEKIYDEQPKVYYYSNNKEIKTKVQDALSVKESKARIRAIKNTFGFQLKADFRSRRDIDAIYLLTQGDEVKLLKPFVDVNTSVFAEPISTYASYRSHVKSKNGQYPRELNKMRINTMPWLLTESTELSLIEEWSNLEKRLYAMGYDSISLIDKLAQMKASQSYYFEGRTGTMNIDHQGVIHRKQQWAKFYSNGKLRKL